MKVARARADVFTLTATAPELSALVAGARIGLEVTRGDPRAPREATDLLARVLDDYDRALARLDKKQDGRSGRPSGDSPEASGGA
jgi:hypothetical protein